MSEETVSENKDYGKTKIYLLGQGINVISVEKEVDGVTMWIKPQMIIEQRDPTNPQKTLMNFIPFFTYSKTLDGTKPNDCHIMSEYSPSDLIREGYEQYLDSLDQEPSRIITASKNIFIPENMN